MPAFVDVGIVVVQLGNLFSGTSWQVIAEVVRDSVVQRTAPFFRMLDSEETRTMEDLPPAE